MAIAPHDMATMDYATAAAKLCAGDERMARPSGILHVVTTEPFVQHPRQVTRREATT